MPVLMHISDLHRSADEPVSNAELVAALERDLNRQSSEDPPISRPDALIVSGDLVKGAQISDPDPEGTINAQYRQAEEFLGELTDLLFQGDRSQVVICPGNHDVNWHQARASMELVPEENIPRDVYRALVEPASHLRWDWTERALYRIVDMIAYENRMSSYWEFVRRFYRDADILRLPNNSDEPLLVELFQGRVLAAAFNSCSANDCFRRRAEIDPEALARMHLDMHQAWEYDLRVAVWHHNTAGPPSADDYLHVEQVYALIEYGFRLGLHGHQHRSELRLHELRLPGYGSLAVLSAGSLAAGHADLPRGTNRQYSVIEIAEDLTAARLHVREIETGAQYGPRRLNAFGGLSYSDITWQAATSVVGTRVDNARLNLSTIVNEAETAFNAEDDDRVLTLLRPLIARLDAYGRRLLANAASRARDWQTLVDDFSPPKSIEEIALVVHAALQLDDFERARSTIRDAGIALGLPDPQRDEFLDQVAIREAIR